LIVSCEERLGTAIATEFSTGADFPQKKVKGTENIGEEIQIQRGVERFQTDRKIKKYMHRGSCRRAVRWEEPRSTVGRRA